VLFSFILAGCGKDKFTNEPQIRFKSFSPNQASNYTQLGNQPLLIFEITDGDGDIGRIASQDTAKVYIRNTLTNKLDSLDFPVIGSGAGKNFKADVEVGLFTVMNGRIPGGALQPPYVDTIAFEFYVMDFAENKSNVILTTEPFYFYRLP
jgi:hypothetical protein